MDTVTLAIVIELCALLISAVWAVATIRNTTTSLAVAIKHLEDAVETLNRTIESIEERSINHEVRISILEKQSVSQ